jgi:ADP-heptose:LPS heptosyltransferase
MSAMGDVALTLPALRAVTEQHDDIEILLVTRSAFRPFFSNTQRLNVYTADLRHRHRGIVGLLRLFRELSATGKFDYIIDLHDVFRSRVLRFLFRLKGVPVSVIDKGRAEKRAIIKGKNKQQLKHSVERYLDVFRNAGFGAKPGKGPWIIPSHAGPDRSDLLSSDPFCNNIGIAPYAKHILKMWPEEYMLNLLNILLLHHKVNFIFFGGKEDADKMSLLSMQVPQSVNVAGKLDFAAELELMSRLDLMIAMDSSNMHMAALAGTKVISIWGATDPVCGFGAWGQPAEYSIKIPFERLECRPCTIFGKGTCRRGDLACMNWLTPDSVYNTIAGLRILK